MESGSGVAGDSLEVSTVGLGRNFELLIRSPHPSIFYFWGLTSSICCQIFSACWGHIELMFPPHLRVRKAARAPACVFARANGNRTVSPIQILKISKLLNFSKFEAVNLPSPPVRSPNICPSPCAPACIPVHALCACMRRVCHILNIW